MKNVIYINGKFLSQEMTGAQRFASEISKYLVKNFNHYVVLAPNNIIHHDLAKELNVKILSGFNGILWEQITLRNFLIKEKDTPPLINLSFTAPIFYKNNVISILDLIYQNKDWVSYRFHYYYSFLVPILAAKAKQIITISNFSKKDIVQKLKINPKKISVIYCGVSDRLVPNKAKNKFGKYVLGVSTLNKRKNFQGLINAFIKSNLEEYNLVIVGSKNNKVFQKALYNFEEEFEKRIIFTGNVSDYELASLFSNAELFVFPSYFEGFGLPPLEAMSLGCPTVVSNTSSLPEVCGNASCYFNPSDVDDISLAIKKVIQNQNYRSDLIKNGYENIKRFSWEDSSNKLNEVIKAFHLN
tara:strand:- start:7049 stop:8116 length:1068 start_codon:yes stop_codon:yes gene_type:complete